MFLKQNLISDLNLASSFIRNRTLGKNIPLDDNEVKLLLDVANTCTKAAEILDSALLPPCKIGSKVYRILRKSMTDEWIIGEGVIVEIRQRLEHPSLEIIEKSISPNGHCEYYPIALESFGLTVFCDKKEAEAKIAGLNKVKVACNINRVYKAKEFKEDD